MSQRCAILLHGLARSQTSMAALAEVLENHGFWVVNSGYPSTRAQIETLTTQTLPRDIASCGDREINFVTHSMGGILVRHWLTKNPHQPVARVVMMSPPNQGSELVDTFGPYDPYVWLNGPAGLQLGTDDESVPNQIKDVRFEVGIIAGNRSINPVYSNLIEGPDDGKVSVASTRLHFMSDHITLPVTHTFMMNNPLVIAQTLEFLQVGKFDHDLTLAQVLFSNHPIWDEG